MTDPKCPCCGKSEYVHALGDNRYRCLEPASDSDGCGCMWRESKRTAPEGVERVDEEYPSQAAKDNAAVDAMAVAMKAKLKLKRDEGYYGWDDPEQCPMDRLAKLLVEHVPKGDVVDIANFCMMIFCRAGYGGGHSDLVKAARASLTPASAEDK